MSELSWILRLKSWTENQTHTLQFNRVKLAYLVNIAQQKVQKTNSFSLSGLTQVTQRTHVTSLDLFTEWSRRFIISVGTQTFHHCFFFWVLQAKSPSDDITTNYSLTSHDRGCGCYVWKLLKTLYAGIMTHNDRVNGKIAQTGCTLCFLKRFTFSVQQHTRTKFRI